MAQARREGPGTDVFRGRQGGFTFLEVMTVSIIIAILAAVAIPTYTSYVNRQRVMVVENLARAASVTLASYYRRNGAPPTESSALKTLVSLPDPDKYDILTGGPALNHSWVQVRETAEPTIASMEIPFR